MNVMNMSANMAAGREIKAQRACAGTRGQAPNDAGSGGDASYAKIFDNARAVQDSDPSADAAAEDSEAAVQADSAFEDVSEAEAGISSAEGSADETTDDLDLEVSEEDAAAGLALGHILKQTRDRELIRQYIEAAFLNRERPQPGVSGAQTVQDAEVNWSGFDKSHGMHLAVGQILQRLRTQQAGINGDNLSDEPGAALSDMQALAVETPLNTDSQIAVEEGRSGSDSFLLQAITLEQETTNRQETLSQKGAQSLEDSFGKISTPAANTENPFSVAARNQTQALDPEFSLLRSQQIVDQVLANSQQVFSQGNGRIKLVLNPPNLGTVDMDVRLQGQKVEVIMVTAEAEVQQALQSHADRIKSAFQAQGIQVDSYEVLCFSDSDPRSFKENAFQGGGRGDSESGQGLGGESSPEISRKTIQITDDSGISVFA